MAKNSGVACPKYDVGGQAVMEGVMMRSPERTAVAVRQESGDVDRTVLHTAYTY